ncbi:MAG TPA: SMI1/KNR4 family protein [Chthoniobacter sp.]|nr:SMI1/KNR4 family protein [Chthoniobacter sp.]
MNEDEWKAFLTEYSRELLADERVRRSLPPEVVESGWLGFAPAGEEEIAAAEARLGTQFPPSYRSFLRVSNGWRNASASIWKMWPGWQIAWFKERNQEWIDAYLEPALEEPRPQPLSDAEYLVYGDEQDTVRYREEYLQTALEISDRGDDAILLLNPRTVTAEGEWEAWVFANWYPGAVRYRSFREMMEGERNGFRKIQEQQKQRAQQRAKAPAATTTKPWWKVW